MKTRVLTGVTLLPLLILLALVAPKEVAMVIYGLMMSVGSYELLYGTRLVQHPRLVIYACVMAFLVTVWSFYGAVHAYAVLGVLLFIIPLFCEMMVDHVKVRFEMVAMTVIAGLIVPYLLTAVVLIPFNGWMVKLSTVIVKDDKPVEDKHPELHTLDEKLYISPAVAIAEAVKAVTASGSAKIVNLASNIGSLVSFITGGCVLYALAIPAMFCAAMGGYVGSSLAIKGGAKVIRVVMLSVMAMLLVKIAWDTFAG